MAGLAEDVQHNQVSWISRENATKKDRVRQLQELLRSPDMLVASAKGVIARAKAQGAAFPGISSYTHTVASSREFARIKQASDESTHNIGHLLSTAILYGVMAADANARHLTREDKAALVLNIEDGIQAGGIHDSRRRFNNFETFFPFLISRHGRDAAKHFQNRLTKGAKSITRHHDDYWVSKEVNTPEFQVFKLADRLGLVRFLLKDTYVGKPSFLRRLSPKEFILRHLLDYDMKESQLSYLKNDYIIVAAALYHLGSKYSGVLKEKFAHADTEGLMSLQYAFRPKYDYQFDGYMKASQELGMIGEDSPQKTDSETLGNKNAA